MKGASKFAARAGAQLGEHLVSVAGRLSAVDVQDLTGDERGTFEVEDAVDDVVDLAEPSERMKAGEAVVGSGSYMGS